MIPQAAARVVRPAVVLGLLVAVIAVANSAAGTGPPTAKQFQQLTRKVNKLQKRVTHLSRQTGPQGPPGATGSPPPCQGNDATDVMVEAGAVCIDRYEASVWSSPTGGTQYGVGGVDDYPCDDDGQDCTNIYARSVAGVSPSSNITWLQAQQALANVGKRLPTNAEWQQAVAGTPDSTACNVNTGSVANTGANTGCVSRFGANDMVGNLFEYAADWDEQAGTPCGNWSSALGDDFACVGRADTETSTRLPAVFLRGGSYTLGTGAGPFAVVADDLPNQSSGVTPFGFRGAR